MKTRLRADPSGFILTDRLDKANNRFFAVLRTRHKVKMGRPSGCSDCPGLTL